MQKYVVQSVEERLLAWRELDRSAAEAEAAVAKAGQAATSPAFRELCLKARELRERSDREFAAIVRCVSFAESDSGGA
jgi:hypothetical protein